MNKYNLNQRKVRKAHDTYVDEIVSGDITNNPKILKKKMKNIKQNTTGIAPLKDANGLLEMTRRSRVNY